MKKQFSTAWNSSKQPRKQRKYRAKAPLHIKRKLLSVNLSKDLRKKYNRRNAVVVKGDTVKVMSGKFRKQTGKIISVFTKISKVSVEGIQVKKMDGSKVNLKLQPSNLQITELNLTNKKRFAEHKNENKKSNKENKENKK